MPNKAMTHDEIKKWKKEFVEEFNAQQEAERPPRREWKSLTSAETKALWTAAEKKPSQFAAMLEAKLKEKNGG